MKKDITNPISSFDNLRDRLLRLLKTPISTCRNDSQLEFSLPITSTNNYNFIYHNCNVVDFLEFLVDSLPTGNIYLFGGVLRDLALLGKRGFNSDLDLVADGEWKNCTRYLEHIGAKRNKFGGYRLTIAGWPIDIWGSKDTWAIKQGLVTYNGIYSLTKTTVLNWDAILMNWRTKTFIYRDRYLSDLNDRLLDIILEDNPNPLGMAVRVFRHLCSKDARKITIRAAEYLGKCTVMYSFNDLKNSEIKSYGNSVIEPAVYLFFSKYREDNNKSINDRYSAASHSLVRNGITLSSKQFEFNL
ncbi:MAG: hypothetical protein AB2792_14585 [Candidatus Thiodiazotropha sp.]